MKVSRSFLIAFASILIGYLLSQQKPFVIKSLKQIRAFGYQIRYKFYEFEFKKKFEKIKKFLLLERKCPKGNKIGIWLAKPYHKNLDEDLLFIGNFSQEMEFEIVKDGEEEEWEILWTQDYLFDRFPDKIRWQPLERHQVINHFPGMTFLTNKLHLATSSMSKYIPSAFAFPTQKNEFLFFAKTKPNAFYAHKFYDKKGMKIVQYSSVNFQMKSWEYIQHLITNPLLVDGYAFDIGVYALMTSFNPLRIYRWNHDILMRFCNTHFAPFNITIIEKINCAINPYDPSQMPSFQDLINDHNFSNIDVLNFHLQNNKFDPKNLWFQIDDAIAKVILDKFSHISKYFDTWRHQTKNKTGKAFELLRFDFVIDDEAKVHLLEVEMSPKMAYGGAGKERKDSMLKKLLKNTFGIIGAGSFAELMKESNATFTFSPHNIAVNIEACTTKCSDSCEPQTCDLCLPCIESKHENFTQVLHESYREHQNRGDFLRIFPSSNFEKESSDYENLNDKMKLLAAWYDKKCKMDVEWCQ